MSDSYTAALARVREYAAKLRNGAEAADRESLDRAADLAVLYEDKRWIKDLEAEGKAPKNKVFRGRPVDPGSRSRFASWVLTHEGLGTSYTGKLLKAHEWRTNYADSVRVIPTEGALRPLYALERRGRAHQTPEVVARAAELAGDGTVTAAHVKAALSEFWAKYSPGEKRRMDRDAEAKRHAAKIRAEARWLIDNGYLRDFAELLTELDAEGEQAASAQQPELKVAR